MSYRWVEHTAELELEIESSTEESLFAEALLAMGELLSDESPSPAGEAVSLELSLARSDRALLLADWLDELVFRAETEGVVPVRVEQIELDEAGLTAKVGAVRGVARPLVKGVTHHRLRFERAGREFRATVVLDV